MGSYGGALGTIVDPFNMGGVKSPKTPNPKKVGKDYLALVEAYIKGQKPIFDSEAAIRPQYTRLGLEQADLVYNGDDDTGGLFELYRSAADRTATARRAMDPNQSTLIDLLNEQAIAGMRAGESTTEEQDRMNIQRTRRAYAANGLSGGETSALDEVLKQLDYGRGLGQERQKFGAQVAEINEGYQDPIMRLLIGENAGVTQALNFSETAGPTVFPGSESYDTFNTAYNASAATKIANANNEAAGDSYS